MFLASFFLIAKSNPLKFIITGSPSGAALFSSTSVPSIHPNANNLLINFESPLIDEIIPFSPGFKLQILIMPPPK